MRPAAAFVGFVACSLLAACGASLSVPTGPSASASVAPSASIPDASVPVGSAGPYDSIDYIVLIVMENHSFTDIVKNSSAPYWNSLSDRYGQATNYTGVAHPSEPNYIALFSGSTQGVTDDGVHDFASRNLADQLEAAGRTWRVVAENVPPDCFTGAAASGGPDGTGTYVRKHEPAIMFQGIAGAPARCANIIGLRQFSLTAANFQLVVPNLCHDTHDCPVADGDSFLKEFVDPITASPAFARTLLVITYDEGTDDQGGGGSVATVLVGPMVRSAVRSGIAHDHYSLLRTIENVWSLGCLGLSCSANDLGEFFGP